MAQGIIAGQWSLGDTHVDPVVDTFLNPGGPPFYNVLDAALWDLNGDAAPDLIIEGFNFVFASLIQQKSIDIRTFGTQTEVAQDFIDTCWSEPDINGDTAVAHIKTMVRVFNENDTIGPSIVWSPSEQYLSYYDYNSNVAPYVNCGYISPYQNDTGYIGIRYFAGGDTLYGWMKFAEPTTHSIKILEWAFHLSPQVALEMYNTPTLVIYPNPVRDFITLQLQNGAENTVVEIFNSQGKYVMEYFVQKNIFIDVSGLPAGFYYIRMQEPHSKAVKFIKL